MSIESRLDKIEEDLWSGRDRNNPSVVDRLSTLEGKMNTAQEGVANFRSFQLKAQQRLGFLQGAVWVGGIAGVVCMALLAWALTLILPAAKLIMDDYYHNHPAAMRSQVEVEQATEIAK